MDWGAIFGDSHLHERIQVTGYVPDDHILPLRRHADLFVVPSLYEGFGLPVLEVQQANVAVACSTAASLPEIAGEGASFFDPFSVDAIRDAMQHCLSDPDLRAHLRRLGNKNLRRFLWDQTAQDTLAVFQQILYRR